MQTTVELTEHVAIVFVARTKPQFRLGLLGSNALEHRDRAGVEADEVRLFRLRQLLDDHLVIECRHLAREACSMALRNNSTVAALTGRYCRGPFGGAASNLKGEPLTSMTLKGSSPGVAAGVDASVVAAHHVAVRDGDSLGRPSRRNRQRAHGFRSGRR